MGAKHHSFPSTVTANNFPSPAASEWISPVDAGDAVRKQVLAVPHADPAAHVRLALARAHVVLVPVRVDLAVEGQPQRRRGFARPAAGRD